MTRRMFHALVVWACLSVAQGRQISWFNDTGNNFDSSGQPMDAGYVFQLGVFDAGFEPSPANITSWLARWNPADSTQYNTGGKRYSGFYTVEENPAPFLPGAKAWVFGRRTGSAGSEWILFRKATWLWPVPDEMNSTAIEWNAKDADTVVFGTIHSSGSPFLMKSAMVRSYAQWQTAHLAGEPLNGPNDNPDADGTPNLLEFAFGTSPTVANAPVATPITLQADHPVITLPRRIDHLANYLVEVSGNLVDWQSGPAHTEILQNDAAALVVRDLTPISPANPKRFIRLKVSLP